MCGCDCGEQLQEFDQLCSNEITVSVPLQQLTHANIGWFSDQSVCEHCIEEWGLEKKEGLYILWHKDDYCVRHEMFHMRALYVGKGRIGSRLKSHWKNKDFSEELLVYFTYVELSNRLSKYIEQLLLDVYHFPYNKAENAGTATLCAHFTQCEVD